METAEMGRVVSDVTIFTGAAAAPLEGEESGADSVAAPRSDNRRMFIRIARVCGDPSRRQAAS